MGLWWLSRPSRFPEHHPTNEKMLGREINGLDGTIGIEGMRPRA
jgi:hypothetical protein